MRRRMVMLLALLLFTTACLVDSSDPTVAAPPGQPATPIVTAQPPAGLDAPVEGLAEALAFTADTVDGAPFDGGEFAGQDLMLWFWAPW